VETREAAVARGPAQAVSVVIPAYQEGPHIAQQIRAVRESIAATGCDFEIIVVDDGSSDETGPNAANEGATLLRNKKNRGYGASLKRGIAEARYDWILIIDADGTYPVEAIPELLAATEDNDMIVGARTGESVEVPLLRRPAKWFLRWLASYLVQESIPDINSGLRLMKKSLVESYAFLLPEGFSFTTTITLAATANGHDVAYIPISYYHRLGESKIRPRHAFDFTLLILRTIIFFNPLRVFLPVGAMLALAGLAKFVYDVTLDNLSESAVLGLLGALIVWSLGLLADQNARMLRRR
jgi:glycosyltransferase involved in cell wall biosynthesis